ncbi:MAG: PAS domain-containing protein, partial [Cyclobacteriaceae bacterium]
MLEEIKNLGTNPVEKLLESILGSAINGIMSFKSIRDNDNEITDFEWLFVNDIASKIVSTEKHKLIGKRLLEVMPDNKGTGLFDKYVRVVETGEIDTFEQYYPHEDEDRWFRISAVKLEDGFTVTFQDITDMKQAIIEVENREKKYQKLFEESLDPIFLIDMDFNIRDANTALEKLFAYEWSELENKKIEDLFEQEEDFNDFSKKLESDDQIDELEVTLSTKNDKIKICLINCVVLLNEDKEPVNYIGVIRDMTRRKQMDRELIVAEKLSMTGKLARTIAHEVRNPLTNLSLALEQLRDEIPEEVDDAELYLSIIKRNSERINKLISNLLNSSKPKDLTLLNASFNGKVKESLALVHDRLKLQNIEVIEQYDPNIPDIP